MSLAALMHAISLRLSRARGQMMATLIPDQIAYFARDGFRQSAKLATFFSVLRAEMGAIALVSFTQK
jgi:hypothetical protein